MAHENDPEPRVPVAGLQKVLIGVIALLTALLGGVIVYSLAHGSERISSVATFRDRRSSRRELRLPPTRNSLTPATAGQASGPNSPAGGRVNRPALAGVLSGLTIAIDPGHNGANATHPAEIDRLVQAGANGTTKRCNTTGTETNDGVLTEAQFNLDVADILAAKLKLLGAKVVMTRTSNDGVGPCVNERAKIGNEASADVAISIHADGNLSPGAHGFDVIYPATNEMVKPAIAGSDRQLAIQLRNALVGAGVPPANYVGKEGLDERDDLAGLNLSTQPIALVELGNMRSAAEAAKLESPTYRARLATALEAGIRRFLGTG